MIIYLLCAHSPFLKTGIISPLKLIPSTLKAIKRANIKLSHFVELQKRFISEKIKTFSDLIIGLPEETYETFSKGVSDLIKMGQHNRIQFNNLSILPNTDMAKPEYLEKYDIQLIENDILSHHSTIQQEEIAERQQMVVGTNTMSGEDWVKTQTFSYMVGFLHFSKIFQMENRN